MHDYFGIAASAERVPERRELGYQFPVVVDLAVVDHHDRAVVVEQRLLSRREIDDRQPPMTEADAGAR